MRIHLIRRTDFIGTVYGRFFGKCVSPLLYPLIGWALLAMRRKTRVSHGEYMDVSSKFPKNRSMRWILEQAPWRLGITGTRNTIRNRPFLGGRRQLASSAQRPPEIDRG